VAPLPALGDPARVTSRAPTEVLVHDDRGCAIAFVGGVGVLLWTGEPTLRANRWAVSTLLANLDRGSGEPTLLQIVAERAGVPDAESRAFIQEVYRKELSGVRRLVSAPLGDGFRQSVVRTIMRGMAVVSGRMAQVVIVATLEDAYRETLDRRATPTHAELSQRVRAMFEALGVPPPS
jgi:hypothetical protein